MLNGGKRVDVNYCAMCKSAYNAQSSYCYQENCKTFEEQLLYDQESKSNDIQALRNFQQWGTSSYLMNGRQSSAFSMNCL